MGPCCRLQLALPAVTPASACADTRSSLSLHPIALLPDSAPTSLVIQDKNKYNAKKYRLVVRIGNKNVTCQVRCRPAAAARHHAVLDTVARVP